MKDDLAGAVKRTASLYPNNRKARRNYAAKVAITVVAILDIEHNKAIEQAAQLAEGAALFPTSADTARHIAAEIRKLKRKP